MPKADKLYRIRAVTGSDLLSPEFKKKIEEGEENRETDKLGSTKIHQARLNHAGAWVRHDQGHQPRHDRASTTPRHGLSPLTTPRHGQEAQGRAWITL
ncbi:hypothetical protein PIB30_052792 [Stylosanthes scabra]|uniref:Uncharacterized protein n=1 Tax=Stylosanthes scabra TaxID=79078 RepID=A0ABU6UHQ6_9FABA|nr:hypothetical protein [Stylosanthes scabra]